MERFEIDDPKQVVNLQKYKQVLASWPMLVLSSNFSNATAIAVDDATRMKTTLGSHISSFTYQSMWVAAGYYDEVWPLMQNLEQFGDFFLRNGDGTYAEYTGYCSQVAQGGRRPDVTPENYPRCLGYYWNWCNQTAIDWYVNKVMRAMVADRSGKAYDFDGVFLDNSDNFNPPRGSPTHCDVRAARLDVHIKLGKMFQQFNKWPVFSFSPNAAERDAIWQAGVGFTKFYEYFTPSLSAMTQLYTDTEADLSTMVHCPTAVKRHPGIPLLGCVAAFLIATGGYPHAYFQYSAANWVVDSSWKWSPLFETNYGKALGPPTVSHYGPDLAGQVWERRFENTIVTLNCTPDHVAGKHVWCIGDIADTDSASSSVMLV